MFSKSAVRYLKMTVAVILFLCISMLFLVSCTEENKNDSPQKTSKTGTQTDKTTKETTQKIKTEKNDPIKADASIDNPPENLVENFEVPEKTIIEIWAINTNWQGSNFSRVRYEIHLVSKKSLQELTQYYKEIMQQVNAYGSGNEFNIEGTMSGHECKVTITDTERIIKDENGKETKYNSEIVIKFPAIDTNEEVIGFDKIFPYDFIDICNRNACSLFGISYNRTETTLVVNSKDMPDGITDYYERAMKKFENFKQVGDKTDFSGQNPMAYVQLFGEKKGYHISVIIMKNQNKETVDTFKSVLSLTITKITKK